jgi:DNA replication protein DnaC
MGVQLPIPPEIASQNSVQSYEELAQMQADFMNQQRGTLTGYDCPDCLNRGLVFIVRNGEVIARECHCKDRRGSISRIEKSGLKDILEAYTFDTYKVDSNWQRIAKQKAFEFLNDYAGKWFYSGGQPGSGKTHLCTAIVGKLMESGKSSRYMLWRDEAVKLKACVNDEQEYFRIMNQFKTADVLYIDDFFKTGKIVDKQGNKVDAPPTSGDINVAFELLNYRYNNQNLVTIISSEKSVDEIMDIDEAIGSRIYQRTKDYCIIIGKDQSKNYRMK